MSFIIKTGFIVATLAASSVASAQWYAGGSVGRSSASFNSPDYSLGNAGVSESQDKTKTAYKIFGGYDFTRNWALEGGYTSLGKPQYNYSGIANGNATLENSSWSLAGKGTLPLNDQFNLFGKLGLTYNRSELTSTTDNPGVLAFPASTSKGRSDILMGLGGEYMLNKKLGLRVEYENFGKFGDQNATGRTKENMWSVGLAYKY